MEWLKETQWLWWVAGALVLGLIEITSLDLVFFMLAVAAVAAAAAAGLDQSLTVQALTFVAVAALLLAVLRPIALRKIKPAGEAARTNADALSGRTAVVLQEVTDRRGLVKLTGEEWTARAEQGAVLAVDETVQVLRIEGATAVVGPLQAGPSADDQVPQDDPTQPDALTQNGPARDDPSQPDDPTQDPNPR